MNNNELRIFSENLCARLYSADKKGHDHLKIDYLDCEMQQLIDYKKVFFNFYGIKFEFKRHGCILSWKSNTFVNSRYFSEMMEDYMRESSRQMDELLIKCMKGNTK